MVKLDKLGRPYEVKLTFFDISAVTESLDKSIYINIPRFYDPLKYIDLIPTMYGLANGDSLLITETITMS